MSNSQTPRSTTWHRRSPLRRRPGITLIAAMSLATASAGIIQISNPVSASAAPGREIVVSTPSPNDSTPVKTAIAYCPEGKRVVGGGGWTQETGVVTRRVVLTELRPHFNYNGGSVDTYVVKAAEATPGTSSAWQVGGYAICVDYRSDLEIAYGGTASSPDDVKATVAVCPPGKRVYGTGARVEPSAEGQVALQVARPSQPGDIARAQAREDIDGYAGNWVLSAYAVCGYPTAGYKVILAPSPQTGSEAEKTAIATCPPGTYLHSAGAAISNVAPAGVSLQWAYPYSTTQARAHAVENTPTAQNWDYIVASAICMS